MMKKVSLSLFGLTALSAFASADVWTDLAQYKMGDSPDAAAPAAVNELILSTAPDQMGPIEDQLIAILDSSSTTHEAKEYTFRMLDRIGSDRSVPVVAKFLDDETLALFARRSLESRADSATAAQALATALPQVSDARKIGIIGSLAERGDARAVALITPYLSSDNVALAKAAFDAVGHLGGAKASAAVMDATVTRTLSEPRVDALIETAKTIEDPGSLYSASTGAGFSSFGGSYVQSEGQVGWKGEYFNNRSLSDAPVFVRQDEVADFDWRQGSPGEGVGKNDFSVRWTGMLTPPESRLYTFKMQSDDGLLIKIGEQVFVDSKGGGYRGEESIELQAGVAYAVEIQFVEGSGDAFCRVSWDCASPEAIIFAKQKIIDVPVTAQQRAALDADADAQIAQQLFESSRNRSLQVQAFVQLHTLDPAQAAKSFETVFAQSDFYSRQALIRAAMELDASYQQQFVGKLSSLSNWEQLSVLGAISGLGLSEHEAAVIALLEGSEGEVYNQAIYTLGAIGGEASFQPLYEAFQKDDENPAITYAITQLQLPSVDQHLLGLVSGESSSDFEARMAAITPLVLRNPEGAAAVFNELVAPSQPEELRKAGFKAIELAGDVESCKVLADLIVAEDPMMRLAQQSLKKAALRINKGHDVWQSAFKPTLTSASATQSQKESLLVIVDGVLAGDSLNFLKKKVMDPSDPLRPISIRMLGRWPEAKAGDVWVELAAADFATVEDQKAALAGLTRILTRDEIERDTNRRLRLALKAIESAPSTAYKLEILKCFEGSENYTRGRMKEHFAPLMSDPELAPTIEALMKNK